MGCAYNSLGTGEGALAIFGVPPRANLWGNMMANEPIFIVPLTAAVEENSNLGIDVTAVGNGTSSIEGDGITYGLLSDNVLDERFFQLDSSTGELFFLTPPDFEMPLDAGGDNVYDV